MPRKTVTVELGEGLAEFVDERTGRDGNYVDAGEYLRDLVRRDKERAEAEAFERLRAELQHAFAAPDSDGERLTAADVIARNRR